MFYISTEEHCRELQQEAHWSDLKNGKVLVCVRWRDEGTEVAWSNHPDVIALPHPIFESTVELDEEQCQWLLGRYPMRLGNTVHDLIKLAAKDNPMMRLTVL